MKTEMTLGVVIGFANEKYFFLSDGTCISWKDHRLDSFAAGQKVILKEMSFVDSDGYTITTVSSSVSSVGA